MQNNPEFVGADEKYVPKNVEQSSIENTNKESNEFKSGFVNRLNNSDKKEKRMRKMSLLYILLPIGIMLIILIKIIAMSLDASESFDKRSEEIMDTMNTSIQTRIDK